MEKLNPRIACQAAFFFLLAAFISFAAPARADTLTVAGRTFTDLKNLKHLYTVTSTTNGNGTFRLVTGTAGYTPSGTQKFRVLAIRYCSAIASQNVQPSLLYADNDVTIESGTAFTNPVYFIGAAGGALISTAAALGDCKEMLTNFLMPNAKYLGTADGNASGAATFQAWGYEENP